MRSAVTDSPAMHRLLRK